MMTRLLVHRIGTIVFFKSISLFLDRHPCLFPLIHPVGQADIVNDFESPPNFIRVNGTWFRVEWYYQRKNPHPSQLGVSLTKAVCCFLSTESN
jgi:hypothetical protein